MKTLDARAAAALVFAAACSFHSCSGKAGAGASVEGEALAVYSSHPADLASPVVAEFRDRTGIVAKVVYGGTTELIVRIRAASREAGEGAQARPRAEPGVADAPVCDVLWGGGAETLAANADLFEPYLSSEDSAIPDAYKAADRAWTGFTVLPMVIGYNTRLLGPEAVPRSWAELLEPRFANAIAYADPSVSASSYTILRTLGYAVAGGEGAERAAAEEAFARSLGGKVLGQSASVFPSVASGEYVVGLFHDEAALELIAKGSDLGIVYPSDGTSAVPDGVALIRGARRTAEAKAFIDFVLGSDVASIMATRFLRRSARSDCPPPAGQPPLSRIALLQYGISESAKAKAGTLARFKDYLSAAASSR